jgi:hypothetical protein
LTIEPGHLVVQPDDSFGRVLSHDPVERRGDSVTVVSQRLAPPWMNTSVVLSDMDSASVPAWQRGRLLSALEAAGIGIRLRKRWLPVGFGRNRA